MATRFPEDWDSHQDWPFGCVCKWCRPGDEHHGVSRAYEARIERLEMLLYRVRHQVLTNPSLMREIDAMLDDGEVG